MFRSPLRTSSRCLGFIKNRPFLAVRALHPTIARKDEDDVQYHKIQTEFTSMKSDLGGVKSDVQRITTEVSDMKNEFVGLKAEIKVDLKELGSQLSVSMAEHAKAQQHHFTQFYFRCLGGVIGLTVVLVGSSWILPYSEGQRLNNEVKRRALAHKELEDLHKEEELKKKSQAALPDDTSQRSVPSATSTGIPRGVRPGCIPQPK